MADRKQLMALGLSLLAVASVTYRVLTWKRARPTTGGPVVVAQSSSSVGKPLPAAPAAVSGVAFSGDEALLNTPLSREPQAHPFVPKALPVPGSWKPLSQEGGERSVVHKPDYVLSGTVRGQHGKAIINHQVLVVGDVLKEGGELLEVGEGWARLRWEGEDVLLLVHPDLGIPLRPVEATGHGVQKKPEGRKVKACYP